MIWFSLLKRTRIRRRRTKLRRGRVVDPAYKAWIAEQGCMISGRPATLHHVRRFGEPKNDHRIVPLAPEYHFLSHGPQSVEALGKRMFERRHGVNLEAKIKEYNRRYERANGLL